MTQPEKTAENLKSGKEVAKHSSRFSATHWMKKVYRPKYLRDGKYIEVAEWFARIQFGGRREAVGLNTNNQEEASRKAARLYQTIRSKGWAEALREFSPERSNPQSRTTIGEHIEVIRPFLSVEQTSVHKYSYCLRRIAMDLAGLNNAKAEKYDPAHKIWRQRADKIKLSILTPLGIEKWKRDFIDNAGQTPVEKIEAKRNVNYFLRNARSLFGKKVRRKMKALGLPECENPFEGVTLEDQGSTRYVSKINADELIRKAQAEFSTSNPDAWKVILLALGAGLRRREIDGLSIPQIDFKKEAIHVVVHDHFDAKTNESIGIVHVDGSLLQELRKHIDEKSFFVVESETGAPDGPRAAGFYRCNETFEKVLKWLRNNGVNDGHPLHVLRKEFGSIINAQSDIYTASNQLRHASITTTADFYADNRKRSTIAIGSMLGARITSQEGALPKRPNRKKSPLKSTIPLSV